MDNVREQVYLAALLHDIGKFYQRADKAGVRGSKYLKDYAKVESQLCPSYKGEYSHKHVLWTAQFFDDFKVVFQKLVNQKMDEVHNKENLLFLAAGHHLSFEQLSENGKLIKEADHLSSGMDRESEKAFEDEQDEMKSWDAFKKKRMTSILETISFDEQKDDVKTIKYHLPIEKMSLEKSTFPQSTFAEDPDYTKLWEEFIGEFKFVQANTYRAFSETLLNLLFKYTACVPASTINFPDVSLFDHLKTTAALAICLYDVKKSGENPESPFLLIGGDISGIQNYIYQIVSKYAAKNLKGRSFYLKVLADSVVRYILKELNLFRANIVYNSGGSFYLIAPNTSFVKEKLTTINATIEKKLFESHGTALYMSIDFVEVSKASLLRQEGKNLRDCWEMLFKKREKKKSSRFSSLLNKGHYNQFFEPILRGGETQRDIITGEEFDKNEKPEKEGELEPLKKITKKQILIGEKLRNFDFLVISEEEIPYWKGKCNVNPIKLGIFFYFLQQKELEEMEEDLCSSADKVTVVTLNGKEGNCDFMGNFKGIDNIYALDFYGGNEIEGEHIVTFEDLCGKPDAEDPRNDFRRLGVLRMDVDNLGYIFQKGIAKDRVTLSRYAALSRSFDYFFAGYLNTIWKEVAPKQSLIIYSGGDDLFIVGSWDKVIQIAKRIREDFRVFTCENKNFSISGGIALITTKFPIMKGADWSEDEVKNAKEHTSGNESKNALSFMNFPLNWDKEFPVVENLKNEICTLIQEETLPKSFISKVLTHRGMANIKEHKINEMRTYWLIAYDFDRMKERIKKEEGRAMIEQCKKEVCGNAHTLNGQNIDSIYHPLELWGFACRWAELELRIKK